MTDLAKQYQRKTDKEHILDNPDTYIGSVETVDSSMWIYDEATGKIALKNIEYVPGLYKLFDEGIVNCRDHVVRMINSPVLDKRLVSNISVTVGEDGTIVMENDGNGIGGKNSKRKSKKSLEERLEEDSGFTERNDGHQMVFKPKKSRNQMMQEEKEKEHRKEREEVRRSASGLKKDKIKPKFWKGKRII